MNHITTAQAAIATHGATNVYQAAYQCLQGRPQALRGMGLAAPRLLDAWDIMSAAHMAMGPAQQAIETAAAAAELSNLKLP